MLMLSQVRPEQLRRYYEAAFDQRDDRAEAYVGATFEEYLCLMRVRFPGISARRAAAQSPTALGFRERAAALPPDPQDGGALPPTHRIANAAEVDLAAAAIPEATEALLLDRVKRIRGWGALRGRRALRRLNVTLCDGEAPSDLRLDLRALELTDCAPALAAGLMGAAHCDEASVEDSRAPRLNLSALRAQPHLTAIKAFSPLVVGLGALRGLPLRRVELLSGAVLAPPLLALLEARASALDALAVVSGDAFTPDALPALPALSRLTVASHPAARAAWVAWAVARPAVACRFVDVPSFAKAPAVHLAAVYRGLAVLAVRKGARTVWQVSEDVSDLLFAGARGHDDIAEALGARAREARRKLTLQPEADSLTVTANDEGTCRWAVDALHALAAGDA